MTVLSMSRAEIDRVHVLKDLVAERIRTREAAQLMGVTTLVSRPLTVTPAPNLLGITRRRAHRPARLFAARGGRFYAPARGRQKGRMERVKRTRQDRLVKDLRLEGISTLEAANAICPGLSRASTIALRRRRLGRTTCIVPH